MEAPQHIGRYEVLREVARGGMGAVFEARDPQGQRVALKLLLAGRQASDRQRRRFANEAQALVRLRHPHLVPLLDAGEVAGVPFLALQWVEGETLAARVERTGPLDWRAAAELGLRLCEALSHCHTQGVLHRDVKPDNVLLGAAPGGEAEVPLLTDFGLARDVEPELSVSGPTQAGQSLGTPGYWAPEQARGELDAIGPRSDVYGLGGVLYFALSARAPQQAPTLDALLEALERAPPPPSRLRASAVGRARDGGVPAWLDALCVEALQPDPGRRPRDAEALAAALRQGLAGRPPSRGRPALLLGAPLLLALAGWLAWPSPAPQPARLEPGPPRAGPDGPPGVEVAQLRARDTQLRARDTQLRARVAQLQLAGQLAAARAALDEALAEALDEALDRDPDRRPSLLVERARVRQLLGDLEGAVTDLDRALALDPRLARAWAERGLVRQLQGDREGARQDLEAAVGLAPQDPRVLATRGILREDQDDRRGAAADLARGQALDPAEPRVHYLAGVLSKASGRREVAVAALGRAIALDPAYAEAWERRAVVKAELADLAGALTDYERALTLAPGHARGHYNRGNVRMRLGDAQGALADYDRAIALDPRFATAFLRRARARVALGAAPSAVADLDAALLLDPRLLAAWIERGQVRLALGDPGGALQDLERAVRLDPRSGEALFERARALEATGEAARARADLELALELEPGAPWADEARALRARLP